MEDVSEQQGLFLIDLRSRRVYCRLCRQACKRLVLPGFVQYWCANHDCGNSAEIRLSRDGTWNTYSVVETMFDRHFSRFSSLLTDSEPGCATPDEP